MTRNRPLHGDGQRWAAARVPTYPVAEEVWATVPADAGLEVHGPNSHFGLELAFYAFPRPVRFVPGPAADRARVEPAGPDWWAVRLPPLVQE